MRIGMVPASRAKREKKWPWIKRTGPRPVTQTEKSLSLLQKGMLFFSITMLVTLLLGATVFYALTSGPIDGQDSANTVGIATFIPGEDSPSGLRNPLLPLMLCTLLFAILISGLLFFIRHIAAPLDTIGRTTRRMTNGQLDHPIRVSTKGEISRIGEFINDLAINMQEVLLYFWNHAQENRDLINRLEKKVQSHPDKEDLTPLVEEIFTELKQGNNDVKSMILLYDFFDLKIEKEKLLQISQTK